MPAAADGRAGRAADHAAAAVVLAAVAVLILHAVRRDLPPASHRLSEYAIGPWGWLMTSAFVLLAAGGWRVRQALPATGAGRPVRVLLAAAAFGFAAAGVVPTDPATPDGARETLHSIASSGALLCLVTAALWTVTLGADAVGWRPIPVSARVAVAVAALCLVISPAVHDGPWTGAVQRLCCGALVAWLLLVCRWAPRPVTPHAADDRRPAR